MADTSIGADGRVVRCAKCRHSWFQDAPELAASSPETPAPAQPEPAPQPEPAAWPEPGPSAAALPASDLPRPFPREPAPLHDDADAQRIRDFADTPSSFAYEPPFRPRRRRLAAWLIAAMLLVLAAIGAAAEFGIPDWLPLPRGVLARAEGAFARAAPDLVLDFPKDRQQQRPLPNGGDFFKISGTIRNTAAARRTVPTLRVLLRDEHNAIVYSLETAPPKPVLAPGESETVDQAIIDAPSSARTAEIGWKPG